MLWGRKTAIASALIAGTALGLATKVSAEPVNPTGWTADL